MTESDIEAGRLSYRSKSTTIVTANMSGVEAGSALAQQIQALVQPKLMENSWVAEETDTTLAEYVTMMIVNGKDLQGVQSELGSDLLGLDDDDQSVIDFAQWLFEQVRSLSQPQVQPAQQQEQPQPIPTLQDANMEDTPASADAPYVYSPYTYNSGIDSVHYTEDMSQPSPQCSRPSQYFEYGSGSVHPSRRHALPEQPLTCDRYSPTGPKSMRNGNGLQRGRGGRMLGQMNRSMDRSADLPDNLRRIKGAAGGQSGRINAHSARDGPPRGPKMHQNIANGVQRMMNGGRGNHHNNMPGMNPMMQGMNANMNNQQQMQFMQMMEMQANLLAQIANNQNGGAQFQNGFAGPTGHAGRGGRGGHRGGRGGHTQEPKLKAVNGKLPDAALPAGPGEYNFKTKLRLDSERNADGSLLSGGSHGDSMEVDGEDSKGGKFSTACRFDLSCTNPDCGFAHHGPATNGKTSIDLEASCSHGAACTNHSCVARHPSPAQRNAHNKTMDCKFYPNCANKSCPFRHPTAPPCRNGADCTTPGCTFGHSKIVCRYNPCLNANCAFKHEAGQKRGNFEDKVWTADGGKAERFSGLEAQTENGEELILPGKTGEATNGNGESQQENSHMDASQMEAQVVT